MTTKAAFTPEEWTTVIEGPTSAGMMVVMASHGGTFRETYAMSKAYVEARSEHGQSELLDEIVSTRPKADHTRAHSPEEMRTHALAMIREAVGLVAAKATPEELEGYRSFVAHGGQQGRRPRTGGRPGRQLSRGRGHRCDHGGPAAGVNRRGCRGARTRRPIQP